MAPTSDGAALTRSTAAELASLLASGEVSAVEVAWAAPEVCVVVPAEAQDAAILAHRARVIQRGLQCRDGVDGGRGRASVEGERTRRR